MKKRLSIFPRVACFIAFLTVTASAQQPSGLPGDPPPGLVRVTLLMLSMPEEKFLGMRPDLLDSKKIELAIPKLFDAAKRKEITLEGFPMVVTKSGQRAVMETELEVYEEYPPPPPNILELIHEGKLSSDAANMTFEKLNPGHVLEVEPTVAQDGVHIDLNIAPTHQELLGFRLFTLPKNKNIVGSNGQVAHIPNYFTMRATSFLMLLSCHHVLLGVFKKPGGDVEIFIVGAEVLDVSAHP